tara:strand:+ start:7740 stop:8519 length:780 start_codon:yes stop_codon:yes gene_type:complete
MRVLSFGGGTNSTALLVGLIERASPPDLVLFADTGGEHQRTYEHVKMVNEWLVSLGRDEIVTVSNASREGFRHTSLEDECINNKTLPSLAFGFKGCSVKWKRQPMDRYIKSLERAVSLWESGGKVTRLIGIDAGESHRGKIPDCGKFTYQFPLIEWGWTRDECVKAILRSGLELPGKSACWYCPASKKHEVIRLAEEHPDLFDRAVAMEANANENLGVVRGLGRHWSWKELVDADKRQLRIDFSPTPESSCLCFDGDED